MKKFVYSFNEGSKDMKDLLGGKGANLAEMTKIGLPVPFGFTVTTEACNRYYEEGKKIGKDLHDPEILDGVTGGYDHSYKFDTKDERDRVVLKGKDLELHISTSFPGVQVYTDNFGVAGLPLNRGGSWERFGAVALEPSFSPLDVNDYAIRDGATQRTFIEYRLEERK